MREDNFLEVLKTTAREQSSLGREKLIPDQLSDLSNFVANHFLESLFALSLLSAITLNLWNLVP